jgi:hypothetical protein
MSNIRHLLSTLSNQFLYLWHLCHSVFNLLARLHTFYPSFLCSTHGVCLRFAQGLYSSRCLSLIPWTAWLHHIYADSPRHPAESDSLSYRLLFPLLLLPTPPYGDAVTFKYRNCDVVPDTDFHRAIVAPSRSHINLS